MFIECERVDGINLAQGTCDTPTPEPVVQGVREALEQGINTYTRYETVSRCCDKQWRES